MTSRQALTLVSAALPQIGSSFTACSPAAATTTAIAAAAAAEGGKVKGESEICVSEAEKKEFKEKQKVTQQPHLQEGRPPGLLCGSWTCRLVTRQLQESYSETNAAPRAADGQRALNASSLTTKHMTSWSHAGATLVRTYKPTWVC